MDTCDREAINSHLVQCERCYFALTESVRLSDEEARDERKPSRHQWERLAWAAALILTTGVLTSVTLVRPWLQQSVAVSAGQHAELLAGPRSPASDANASAPDDQEQRLLAETRLWATRNRQRDLVNGASLPAQTYDVRTRLLHSLQAGQQIEPTSRKAAESRVQNGLAEVFLQRWRDTKHLDDAVAAFEQAQNAVAANPRFSDARVNLALALEAISASFRRDAKKTWEDYLTFDSTSSRAKDIKRHLETYTEEPTSGSSVASVVRPTQEPRK